MMWNVVAVIAVLGSVRGQFQLVWNTPGVATPAPVGPGGFNPNCKDTLPNCKAYGQTSCKAPYDGWAKQNCANTCQFCIGPTEPPPECKDTISNCDSYSKSVCSDPQYEAWATKSCRYYCRKCPPNQLAMVDAHTTPIPAAACKDTVDCRLYGKSACTGDYAKWAKGNCPEYCGICTGVPTPPAACTDKMPNCASYEKSTCTDPAFAIWVEDHCRKYCGKCGAGSVPVQPVISHPTSGAGYAVPPVPGKRHAAN